MSSAISAARRARSSRDSPALLCELLGDLRLDAGANGAAVLDVEETRAELADEREVDPVLQLGEGIRRAPVAVRRVQSRGHRPASSRCARAAPSSARLPQQQPPPPVVVGIPRHRESPATAR